MIILMHASQKKSVAKAEQQVARFTRLVTFSVSCTGFADVFTLQTCLGLIANAF
jgi:hypothetical protein